MTGWTVAGLTRGPAQRFIGIDGRPGDFVFAARIHEPGARTILGRSYRQEGEAQAAAVLRDLAADPRTARHLATKLARHFAGDEPPPALVAAAGAGLARQRRRPADGLPGADRGAGGLGRRRPPNSARPGTGRSPRCARSAPAMSRRSRRLGLMNQLGQPVWRPGSPAGFDDIAASWAGPDALMRRVEAAERIASRTGGLIDARTLGPRVLPGALGPATTQAIARAESPGQGLALLLVAPEFLRR